MKQKWEGWAWIRQDADGETIMNHVVFGFDAKFPELSAEPSTEQGYISKKVWVSIELDEVED